MRSVLDTLTEEERSRILDEDINNPLSMFSISFDELLTRNEINPKDAEKYIIVVYDKSGELVYAYDLMSSCIMGMPGIALEIPYSYELRNDINVRDFRDLLYATYNPSREESAKLYNKIVSQK